MSRLNISLIATKVDDKFISGLKNNLEEKEKPFVTSIRSEANESTFEPLTEDTELTSYNRGFFKSLADGFFSLIACTCSSYVPENYSDQEIIIEVDLEDETNIDEQFEVEENIYVEIEDEDDFLEPQVRNRNSYSSSTDESENSIITRSVGTAEGTYLSNISEKENITTESTVSAKEEDSSLDSHDNKTNISEDNMFKNDKKLICRPVSSNIESLISRLYNSDKANRQRLKDPIDIPRSIKLEHTINMLIQQRPIETCSITERPADRPENDAINQNTEIESTRTTHINDNYLIDKNKNNINENTEENNTQATDILKIKTDKEGTDMKISDVRKVLELKAENTEVDNDNVTTKPVNIQANDITESQTNRRNINILEDNAIDPQDQNYYTQPRMFSFNSVFSFFNNIKDRM